MHITHPQAPRADLTLAAARSAPTAALPMADAAEGHAAPANFASLLRQQQAAPAERPAAGLIDPPDPSRDNPQAAPAADAADAADAAEPAQHEADAAAPKPRSPTRLKTRGPDKAATPDSRAAAGPADAANAARAAEADAAKRATDSATPTMDPALAAWVAALQAAPVAPGAAGADARSAAQGPAQGIDGPVTAADGAGPAGTHARSTTDLRTALSDKADKAERAAHALAENDAARAVSPTLAPVGNDATPALTELAAAQPIERKSASPAATVAAFNPAPTALREVAPPPTVLLPTPFDAPDFSHALGLQVSVLAKGGVQHAELQLNPADMGPVSVQIVMDGTRAQVDFGADLAATRQAIEAGMPALASALRDAGFTLAGGGVSQHSRGRSDNTDARAQAVGGPRAARRMTDAAQADIEAVARTATRRTVRLGGLDLYA